jgi:adenosine kinase
MDSPRTLICGSLAYDTIMVFPDRFARHILPEQLHLLSVSFQIGEMRREWGGCAGNIAYNLQGLGGAPVVMATLGDDGVPYRERMDALGIAQDGVRTVPGMFTAQAFIITDLDDNQITAFHPGAMNASHENRVGDVERIALGIVAPDGRDGMRAHVEQFANAKIPFIFDPGQGLPLFSGPELLEMIDAATYLAVNDYEGRLLAERTGVPLDAIARRVDAVIETLGGEGSRIHTGGRALSIPAVPATALVDPTGCGDAYRAGLLYGIAHGFAWERTGRLAGLLGTQKIASRGGQNHAISRDAIGALFHEKFGEYLW